MRGRGRRDAVDRAWARSRRCGLDEGATLDLPYRPTADGDAAVVRAARPILDYLGGLLPASGTAAVLLDADGRLLVRICGDAPLLDRMDRGSSAPGFVWSEEFAGANAAGTALEEQMPTWMSGQDHYLEALRDLACAAVPITNPLTQRVEGVLDLTATLTNASSLMLPLALQAARAIEQRLADAGTRAEQLLLRRFLAVSRRPGKIVLVLGDRTELSTPAAARLLTPGDRTVLAHLAEGAHVDSGGTRELVLSDGSLVEARFETIEAEGRIVGSVVAIEAGASQRPTREPPSTTGVGLLPATASAFLGRSPASVALRKDAQGLAGAGVPLLIAGEPGVGKVHLAKVLGQDHGRTVLLDTRSYSSRGNAALLREVAALSMAERICVVLRHLDGLPNDVLHQLGSLARRAEGHRSRFVGTVTSFDVAGGVLPVPVGVRLHVPPLRERPEDVLDLAPALLTRRGSSVRISAPVLQAFLRYPWPGNVSELDAVLAAMLHRRHGSRTGGELTLADLPVAYHRGGRRLRRIEHVERTAIVQALAEAEGNRTRAAELLEIGRATLYRKMRAYGLDASSPAAAGWNA